jgi:thioredoxin 1
MTAVVRSLTASEFDVVLAEQGIIFVDFGATWCAPCRQFEPVFERVAFKHQQQVMFVSIDIEKQSALAETFQIRSIPHLMVFKQGIAIYSESGSVPESTLNELVQQALDADVSAIRQQLDAGEAG